SASSFCGDDRQNNQQSKDKNQTHPHKGGHHPDQFYHRLHCNHLKTPSFSFSSPFLVNKQGYAVHNRGTTFSPQRFPVKLSTHEVLFPFFHGTTPIKKEPARIRPGFPHFEAEIVPTHSPRNWGV